mmetsp:Transcript_29066/g.30195  ORF Transcript_29066/g.30195 Transcript_29066/m.30195 type:complete len:92 (-) Transcript_29066:22-297(-)
MSFYLKNLSRFRFVDMKTIESTLKQAINVKDIAIQDTTCKGGCGQSYSIEICSENFQGKSLIQQHRLLNEILKNQIVNLHSVQYKTSIPKV